MVKYSEPALDTVFGALADPTRRGILAALAGGSRPVSELARPHDMSLPGFLKHLGALEAAGLIERRKEGRVVRCTLSPEPMRGAAEWLAHYRQFWEARLDALARYLYQQEEVNPWQSKASRKGHRSGSSAHSRLRRKGSGRRSSSRRR
jgi:DNA-binding transcriptional ArsR family regulator